MSLYQHVRASSWVVGLAVVLLICSLGQAKTSLVLLDTLRSEPEMDVTRLGIKRFEDEHPDVEVELLATTSSVDAYHEKLMSMWLGGVAFDAFRAQQGFSHIYFKSDMFETIDPYIAKDKSDPNVRDFLIQYTQVFEGQRIGFPDSASAHGLIINEDLFEAVGLQSPARLFQEAEKVGTAAQVWNWTTMATMGQRITRDLNGDGIPDQWGLQFGLGHSAYWFKTLIWAAGGEDIFSRDGKRSLLNTPEALQAIEYAASLVREYGAQAPPGAKGNFNNGQAAMKPEFIQAWLSPNLAKTPFTWNYVPMPAGPAGFHMESGSNGYAISSRSPHKELAYQLIKSLTSRETQIQGLRTGAAVRANRFSVLRSSDLRALGEAIVKVIPMFDALAKYGHPRNVEVEWASVRKLFQDTATSLYRGDISPPEAQNHLHTSVQALLQ